MTTYTEEQIREAVNLVIGDDGKRADEIIDVLETDVKATTRNYLRSKYNYPRKPETSWKDRRIDAMNRKIKAYPKASKARTEHYLDEYNAVISSEATSKKEYKIEQKAKQRGFYL
jgi:ABC-type phosphate transport system substrate-binding protein